MRIFFILLIFISPFLCADTELPVFYETNDDFSISLPEGWTEIPRDVLDEFMANIRMLMPQAAQQYYSYGYQPATNEWLEHPYILIQINRDGRIPENQLKQYRQLEQAMEKGVKEVEEQMSEFVSNAQQGEVIYEPENKILWSSMSMDVAMVGTVKAILGIRLTQYGCIQLLMYTKEDSFETYKDIYRDVALNVNVSPEIEYQTRAHEQLSPQMLKLIIFVVIALIVIGIKKASS